MVTNARSSEAEQRADFLAFLDQLEAALKLPPKDGYRRRCSYITIEDECDAGSESESPWEIEQADIDMIRAAFAAALPDAPQPATNVDEIIAHALDETLEPRNRLQGVIARLRLLRPAIARSEQITELRAQALGQADRWRSWARNTQVTWKPMMIETANTLLKLAEALAAPLSETAPSGTAKVPEGWIPISERLPEEGQEVFLAGVPEHQRYQCYARPDWIGPNRTYKATHWMPLPVAPSQSGNSREGGGNG